MIRWKGRIVAIVQALETDTESPLGFSVKTVKLLRLFRLGVGSVVDKFFII